MLSLMLWMLGCTGNVVVDTATPAVDTAGDSGNPTASTYLQPVWVGFEYVGGWDQYNDALEPWRYAGLEYEPYIRIIFVEERFFTTNSDDASRYLYYCEVLAHLEGGSAPLEARQQEDGAAGELWGSYTGTLSVFGYGEGDCENFDPAIWPGGEARWAVDGMEMGLGLGPHTDFLASAWDEGVMSVYGDYMLSAWFAYHRTTEDGGSEFVAHDWATALLWQWDVKTGELLIDPDNRPIGQSTSDPFLSGWVSSYAYYFDLVDRMEQLQLSSPGPSQ